MEQLETQTAQKVPWIFKVFYVIGIVAAVVLITGSLVGYSELTAKYGVVYIVVLMVSAVAQIAALVGYFLMRRWGVYLYVSAAIVSFATNVLSGKPIFDNPTGIIFPLFIIFIGIAYLKRMR